MIRHRLTTIAAASLAAALTVLSAVPAQAATTADRYTALGDSYAVGWGADTPYPVILADGGSATVIGSAGDFRVGDLLAQVSHIPTTTTQVTVTIGGNDAGFSSYIADCAQGDCPVGKIAAAILKLPTSLTKLLTAIEKRAPKAKVYITGYPLLFQPQLKLQQGKLVLSCDAFPVTPAKSLAAVDALTVALNVAIATAAKAVDKKSGHEVVYVDVMAKFSGHGVCQGGNSWINNPLSNLNIALHPNNAGQAGYAAAINAKGFKS